MNYQINPRVISPPAANYSHAVLSTNPEKILHTSGVVPLTTDGSTPVAIRDQADLVWLNITEILREAHLELSNIVSITTYVVSGNFWRTHTCHFTLFFFILTSLMQLNQLDYMGSTCAKA